MRSDQHGVNTEETMTVDIHPRYSLGCSGEEAVKTKRREDAKMMKSKEATLSQIRQRSRVFRIQPNLSNYAPYAGFAYIKCIVADSSSV